MARWRLPQSDWRSGCWREVFTSLRCAGTQHVLQRGAPASHWRSRSRVSPYRRLFFSRWRKRARSRCWAEQRVSSGPAALRLRFTGSKHDALAIDNRAADTRRPHRDHGARDRDVGDHREPGRRVGAAYTQAIARTFPHADGARTAGRDDRCADSRHDANGTRALSLAGRHAVRVRAGGELVIARAWYRAADCPSGNRCCARAGRVLRHHRAWRAHARHARLPGNVRRAHVGDDSPQCSRADHADLFARGASVRQCDERCVRRGHRAVACRDARTDSPDGAGPADGRGAGLHLRRACDGLYRRCGWRSASSRSQQAKGTDMNLIEIVSIAAAALAVSFGAIGPALAEGRAVAAAMDAIARQPDAAGTVSRTLFVGLAMIETMAIYCLVIALLLLFANPLLK